MPQETGDKVLCCMYFWGGGPYDASLPLSIHGQMNIANHWSKERKSTVISVGPFLELGTRTSILWCILKL